MRSSSITLRLKRLYILWALIFSCLANQAQNTTLNSKKPNDRESLAAHKVLLVPFEPKLYNSEIDRKINAETKLSSREIKHKFRDGLNDQLYKALKGFKYNVADLMDDTAKSRKDLEGIYQYLSYEYLKVPNQANYKIPEKEKTEKKIDKGQLMVETNSEQRYMEARIYNQKVLPVLFNKYKTDVFIFINQLDLKASGSKETSDPGLGNPNRKIVVHYTVYTKDGKELNSGVAEEDFDPLLNNPKKIIDKHFSKIASTLALRVNKALGFSASGAH